MLRIKEVMGQLSGKGVVDAFIAALSESLEDFSQVQRQYAEAMEALQTALGDSLSVQEERDAIESQTASGLLFSAYLGLKANLDNFINPMGRCFLEVDSDVYLRENLACRLPEYERAQAARNRFYARLSPAQREIYEGVVAYTSYLETVGPKLAHHFGYMLGNELLPRVIPGYVADPVQTARYKTMIRGYFKTQCPFD